MSLKDLILPFAQKDQNLFRVLTGLIEEKDILTKKFNDLVEALKLPDNLYGHSHMPKTARLIRVTNQTIVDGILTPISFTAASVYFDNDIMWDPAFPTRLTAKTPGKYLWGGCVKWADIGDDWILQLSIRRNGVNLIVSETETFIHNPAFSVSTTVIQNCSTEFQMAKNDYVELVVQHIPLSATIPLDIIFHADYSPVLWGCMVERGRNKGPLTENVPSGDFTR